MFAAMDIGQAFHTHRPRLMLAARIVVAALVAFALAHVLGLKQSYWAVLTAIIVMQASVGGAIKAVIDRLVGSLGGAVWGVIICLALPNRDLPTLALALVLAVAPLAVATAFNPAWRIAPVTALILLLAPSGAAAGPVATAMSRMLEVGVGSLVAVAVALTLARSQARANLATAAARALGAMAELFAAVVEAITDARPPADLDPIHARIRAAIAEADGAAAEMARERLVTPQGGFDPAPLTRTLRRLHHDMIMVARASTAPLPEAARQRLQWPMGELSGALCAFLAGAAEEIARGGAPPEIGEVKAALGLVSQAVNDLRTLGMTRELADDAVARLFGLAFALEQLAANLGDLSARAGEMARG